MATVVVNNLLLESERISLLEDLGEFFSRMIC
jgi:hypothetical protein